MSVLWELIVLISISLMSAFVRKADMISFSALGPQWGDSVEKLQNRESQFFRY